MTNFDPAMAGLSAVGRRLTGGLALDLFFSGPAGIYQTWQAPSPADWNIGPSGELLVQPLGAPSANQSFPHPPSAVSWQPDRLDLFAVSAAGDLWHWWANDESQPQTWWGSESLGRPDVGALDSGPSAVVQDVNKITVFARAGGAGTLCACVWDPANGLQWAWSTADQSGWPVQPGGYAFSPATCSWSPDRIDLFGVTGDPSAAFGNVLQHTWQQDSPGNPGWHPDYWEAAGTIGVTSSPVAVSWADPEQIIVVLYCGPTVEGTRVGMTRWLGDHWVSEVLYEQQGTGDGIAGYPALASTTGYPTPTGTLHRLDAFWIRSDYQLQHGRNDNQGDVATWDFTQVLPIRYPPVS